jgi:hypothetical protein
LAYFSISASSSFERAFSGSISSSPSLLETYAKLVVGDSANYSSSGNISKSSRFIIDAYLSSVYKKSPFLIYKADERAKMIIEIINLIIMHL